MRHFKDIPPIANITQQEVMDNYFQAKIDIKSLITKEVNILIANKESKDRSR